MSAAIETAAIEKTAVEAAIVGEVMQQQVVTVDAEETLAAVRDLFTRYRFQHLAVMSGETLAGVVSDHDLLKHISPYAGRPWSENRRDAQSPEPKVHQLIARSLETVRPECPIAEAARQLLRSQRPCLPVVDADNRLVGILTLRDLVRAAFDRV